MNYKNYDFEDTSVFHLLGRTTGEGKSIGLPWSYSGFEFVFRGNHIVLKFDEFSDELPAYIKVTVDGTEAKYGISDGRETVVTANIGEGFHTARVMRVTEGMSNLKIKGLIIAGASPEIIGKPAEKHYKLLFIGDSITCGYGIFAAGSEPGFNTFEEDCTLTYAYECAKMLDAEFCFTGASGKGIVANCEGNREDMTLRQALNYETRQGGEWNHSRYIPDMVVINAGTNDAWGGVKDDEFKEVGLKFLCEIKEKYPNVKILWAYGIMDESKNNCIRETVEEFNGKFGQCYSFDCGIMYCHENEKGGGGHPNTETSARVAPLLYKKIKEIM